MIPLRTDYIYKLPFECPCGGFGCPLCQVSLTCEITNTSNKPLTVYSGDLVSNDPKIVPVSNSIPLLKLDRNSKFIVEAYAILGIAKDHIKWQAVSNVSYRFYPVLEFDENMLKDEEENQNIVNICPKKIFTLTNDKSLKLEDDYWKICNLCKSCENISKGKIKVGWIENKYLFSIESDGVLPFNVLIEKVFNIFNEKIDEFVNKLGEIEIES